MADERRSWRHDERGGATIVAAVAATVLVLITVALLHVGVAAATRHRAQAAADLAALAAAGAARHGTAAACASASELARRMRVQVTDCVFDGWDATVRVQARVELGAFGARTVVAVARAGPTK